MTGIVRIEPLVVAVLEHPLDVVALSVGASGDLVDGSPVVARLILPDDSFAPVALARAVDGGNLHLVLFAFDEHVVARPRVDGAQLAERLLDRSVVVEDRLVVKAGAHDLVAFEVTLFGNSAAATDVEVDVVNQEAVAGRVDATVLAVFPSEGVFTGNNRIVVIVPAADIGTIGEHLRAVNLEDALVKISVRAFAHAVGIEFNRTVHGVVHRGGDGRRAVGNTAVTALHAVAAAFIGNSPGISAVVVETVLAEVASLEVDDARTNDGARRDRVVFPSERLPHSPTGAAHVEVLHTVDDLGQHIAEVSVAPDGLFDLEEFVTRQIDRHEVVTLTERSDGLEARGIQRDGRLRVVELFAFVEVGEAHDTTLRAVGAVAHDVDGDVGLHVLVDARTALVAPHDLALALLERIVDTRVVRVVGLVAGIDGAHAILVDANGHFGPLDIEVRRVGTPHGGQERGVLTVVRTIVVAVGTIDVEVVQGTVLVDDNLAATSLHDDVRTVGRRSVQTSHR